VPLFYFIVHFHAIWIGIVIAMYPLCLWFARLDLRWLKPSRSQEWLPH